MTKYREILRLTALGFSQRDICSSAGVSQKTVSKVQKCFLQVQIPKSCKQKWRKLHLHFGESCRGISAIPGTGSTI